MTRPRKPSGRAIRDLHEVYARTVGRSQASSHAYDAGLDDAARFIERMSERLVANTPDEIAMLPKFRAMLAGISAGIRAMGSKPEAEL
jgi:hypothetical protein